MRVTHAGLHLCRTGTFKMQDVFDMVYSLLVFVNMRVILYKTYVVLIYGKYNTLTLEFKINIAICVPTQVELIAAIFHLSCRPRFRPEQLQKLPRSQQLHCTAVKNIGTGDRQCDQSPHTHSHIGKGNATSHMPTFHHC